MQLYLLLLQYSEDLIPLKPVMLVRPHVDPLVETETELLPENQP
jgi:hypothetical protein